MKLKDIRKRDKQNKLPQVLTGIIGSLFLHKKGFLVMKISECIHSETLEPMVLYKEYMGKEKGFGSNIWARPKDMFEEIERFKPITLEEAAELLSTNRIKTH